MYEKTKQQADSQLSIETRNSKFTDIEMSLYDPINDGIVTNSDIVILKKSTEFLRKKNKSNPKFNLLEINDKNVAKNIASDQIIFSILIDSDVPYSIFNLVVKYDMEYNEIEQSVVRYKMNHNFGTDYYQHLVGFEQFEGSIQFFDPEFIFNTTKSSSRCLENMNTCTINGNGSNDPNTGSGVGSTGSNGEPNYGGGTQVSGCIFIEACINCRIGCAGACHPKFCECSPKSRYVWYLECQIPLTDNDNTYLNRNPNRCPDENDIIPIINTPVIGDEDSGPTDFTDELQAGLNSNNFINDFLAGNTSLDPTSIVDAAECAKCEGYASGEDSGTYNNCVLTQILDDAPCADALTNFMADYSLALTPAQQLNLVGPGAIQSGCGENGTFVDDAFEILCEKHDFCANEITIVDNASKTPKASAENPPCPKLFEFTYIDDNWDPESQLEDNPTTQEAGLTDMNLTFNFPGETITFNYPRIFFTVGESSVNCGQSHAESASQAIQEAIILTENLVSEGIKTVEEARLFSLSAINTLFQNIIIANCSPEGSAIGVLAGMNKSGSLANEHKNTIFTNFTENFENKCP